MGLDRMMPRLRAVCLLAMYLGIYRAAGEDSELGGYFSQHAPCSRYLDSLGMDVRELREFAGPTGIVATDAETGWEDEDFEMGLLYELASELVGEETRGIFGALVDRYGGKPGLFAALWNSRRPAARGARFGTRASRPRRSPTSLVAGRTSGIAANDKAAARRQCRNAFDLPGRCERRGAASGGLARKIAEGMASVPDRRLPNRRREAPEPRQDRHFLRSR